jgi:hypothetical protein
MTTPAEGRKAGGDHRRILDRRVVMLLEEAAQPPGGNARVPAGILEGDQHRQLQRLGETNPVDLLRGRLGDEQVLVLDRSAKDCAGVALRGQTFLLSGAGPAQRV